MKKTKKNSECYSWGTGCEGWHLVQSEDLSMIEELMPPLTEEQEHYHNCAQQFFYILEGVATFEVAGKVMDVAAGEGIYIPPRSKHQIRNEQAIDLKFLVVSQPSTRGDRVNIPFSIPSSLSLNEKKFKAQMNTDNGEVSQETIFYYRQKGDIVWATYEGGDILFGTLSGSITGDQLTFTYQHQNLQGDFKTGKCTSIVIIENEKLTLHESWEWTCDDYSKGTSVLVET